MPCFEEATLVGLLMSEVFSSGVKLFLHPPQHLNQMALGQLTIHVGICAGFYCLICFPLHYIHFTHQSACPCTHSTKGCEAISNSSDLGIKDHEKLSKTPVHHSRLPRTRPHFPGGPVGCILEQRMGAIQIWVKICIYCLLGKLEP